MDRHRPLKVHRIGISETRDPSLLAATETSFPLHCNLRRSEKGKKEKNYCAERLLLKETVERKKASAIGSWNREKWRFRRRRANFRRGEARRRSLSGLERRRKKRTTQQQQRSSDRERERKRVLVGFENKYKKLNKKQKQLKMRTRNEGGRINTRRDSVVCNNKQLQILKLFFYSKKYFIHLKISVF